MADVLPSDRDVMMMLLCAWWPTCSQKTKSRCAWLADVLLVRAKDSDGDLRFHGVMKLDELFAKHDEDNDGVLDLKEFTSLCQAPCTTVLKGGSQMLSDEQTWGGPPTWV